MSSKITLEAQQRSETGKGAARSLRRKGYIPGVVYGHDEETRLCQVESKQLEKLLTSISYESTLIDLTIDGREPSSVLIREVQVHPYRPEVLHIDFLAVRKGEKVKLEVPIRLTGVAPGVKEGGIMEYARHEVEIRCLPSQIPEILECDITTLGIGDSVTVADLSVPEGVEILEDATATIAAVVPPTVHKVEEPEAVEVEAEEAPEPELVGRQKAVEEEEKEED